jgi:hypothetical protein
MQDPFAERHLIFELHADSLPHDTGFGFSGRSAHSSAKRMAWPPAQQAQSLSCSIR